MITHDSIAEMHLSYLDNVLIQAQKYHISHGDKGCDPRLFWYFPAYKFSLKKRTLGRALFRKTESLLIRLFPKIIRPYQKLCHIPDVISPYGLALFVQAYCKMFKVYGNDNFLTTAIESAKNLIDGLLVTPSGNLGVSNPLEDRNSINLPAGSEAVYALIDLYDITMEYKYLSVAEKITDAFDNDFTKKTDKEGNICFDYTVGGDGTYVLNANALAVGAMAQLSERLKIRKYDAVIESVVNYIKPYICDGEDIPYAGIEDLQSGKIYDVYHTGFTLRGLMNCLPRLSTDASHIQRAVYEKLSRMRADFLNRKGLIQVSIRRRIIDVHGVAEYIRCLSELGCGEADLDIFVKNVKFMYKNGGFYYQRGIRDIYIYMPRWGHAPMMLAIAEVILKNDAFRSPDWNRFRADEPHVGVTNSQNPV